MFDLSGGRLCLDFTNTVGNRGTGEPTEHLRSYGDLLAWAQQAGAVAPATARELRRKAGADAKDANEALGTALAVREALYRSFAALAAGRALRAADLSTLNDQVPWAYSTARLASLDRGFALKADGTAHDLKAPLAAVVKSAVDLMTSADLDRVRVCAAKTCAWLFIDTTKNHTRRWCDMKVCGNREKVRRFRQRDK